MLDLFAQAATDPTLKSTLERQLDAVGEEAKEQIAMIRGILASAEHYVASYGTPDRYNHSISKITDNVNELLKSAASDALERARKLLREGHSFEIPDDFFSEALQFDMDEERGGRYDRDYVPMNVRAIDQWNSAAFIAQRQAKFGNLAEAAWLDTLKIAASVIGHGGTDKAFDLAKKSLTYHAYYYEKDWNGKGEKCNHHRYEYLPKLRALLAIIRSLHTKQPLETDVILPAAMFPESPVASRDLYRFHELQVEGVRRMRPFSGNHTMLVELVSEETAIRLKAELERVIPRKEL